MQLRTADGLQFGLGDLEREELSLSFVALAESYSKNKQFQEARWACEQALRISPDPVGAHMALADVYMELGDLKRAANECNRVAQLGSRELPSDPKARGDGESTPP